MTNMRLRHLLFTLVITVIFSVNLKAQECYEIQVYASEITEKNTGMIELHSNISPKGPNNVSDFSHPVHETVEFTAGVANNFEIGFYLFNRINNGKSEYIGSHIRPRITAPESWGLKWGASLSFEAGFVKDPASDKTSWDYEIRPIIDRTIGKNYLSINPTFDGVFNTSEFSFSPNIKYTYKLHKLYSIGVEYYGVLGKPFSWDKKEIQTHQLYLVTDLELSPDYEINFGIGHGITQSSDQWNIKLILGRRVEFKSKKKQKGSEK